MSAHRKVGCTENHPKTFVTCIEGVVYSLPLSCGRENVGRTGRCLNDRCREHFHNPQKIVSGYLGIKVGIVDALQILKIVL